MWWFRGLNVRKFSGPNPAPEQLVQQRVTMIPRDIRFIRKYWFLSGLVAVCLLTLADGSGVLAFFGEWVKRHHGPDLVIMFIFLFSGAALKPDQLRSGMKDVTGIWLAAVNIFFIAPLVAILFGLLPLDTGVLIGMFLVAVMPSTLSSGVVMTAAAGGNAAHALIITIVANSLAVFTIPYALSFLLMTIGEFSAVTIDKTAIMLKIAFLVVLPLSVGMMLKLFLSTIYSRMGNKISIVNQCLILFIVWIGVSQTRGMLFQSGMTVGLVVLIVFVFHGILLLSGWGLIRISGRGRGRRESILFMGGQKTLPLSIILQVSLFPHYGIALLVCVLHHIVHLMMDGYIVERLKADHSDR